MSFNSFLHPGFVEIEATIVIDGKRLSCRTTVDPLAWEHPERREAARRELKAALVYGLLDRIEPKFTVRVT